METCDDAGAAAEAVAQLAQPSAAEGKPAPPPAQLPAAPALPPVELSPSREPLSATVAEGSPEVSQASPKAESGHSPAPHPPQTAAGTNASPGLSTPQRQLVQAEGTWGHTPQQPGPPLHHSPVILSPSNEAMVGSTPADASPPPRPVVTDRASPAWAAGAGAGTQGPHVDGRRGGLPMQSGPVVSVDHDGGSVSLSAVRARSSVQLSLTPEFLGEPQATLLSDVQQKLQQIRSANESDSLRSRYLLSNSARYVDPAEGAEDLSRAHVDSGGGGGRTGMQPGHVPSPVSSPQQQATATMSELQRQIAMSRSGGGIDRPRPRFKNRRLFHRKLVLLGYQEVGKTSLRKCFESEPFFFKRLPDVRTTTGVEVNDKRMYVDGESIKLTFSDFAGQEAYHSHTYFLTDRSIFGLVWKISAVEQDFNSSGINAREEERLYKWIAEVYAKFPRARIVLIATHLDELRVQGQRSVEMILNKVEGKVRGFIDRIAGSSMASAATPGARGPSDTIVGNFAVSCKTRLIIAAGDKLRHLSGEKISTLLTYLAEVAKDDCMTDREYPAAAIPGRHAKLIEDVEQLKRQQPEKLLMPISELVHMAVGLGIESEAELMQVARLMHCWDVIYLLNPHHIEDNLFIMLHPRWLSRMSAALFSYAHVLRTPLHLRSFISGLEYTISQAEAADLLLMRKGFLRWPLARILFHKPLAEFLHRTPDDSDISMCLQLLEAMSILYRVTVPCDDYAVLMDESPVEPDAGRPVIEEEEVRRYFIPSLSPQCMPASLKRIAPVLLHRGVRVRLKFNFLPDELWWRLQAKLSAYVQEVTVHQPYCPAANGLDEDDESVLFDGYRLKEADDEHNRWKDAMWLQGPNCRVLVYRESLTTVSIYSAETELRASEEVMQAVEDAASELLDEYRGVQRTTLVACPNGNCEGWLSADEVASSTSVTCAKCEKAFDSGAVIFAPASSQVTRTFSSDILAEVGELFSLCLSHHSCLHLCRYLGVPYAGPVPERERTPGGTIVEAGPTPCVEGTHVEYLHALDKVVQAVLFLSWMDRAQERERRKRMLEEDPSPVYF